MWNVTLAARKRADEAQLLLIQESRQTDFEQKEQLQEFEELLDRAYENKLAAIEFMPEQVQQVFLESFHDFRVISASYEADSLRIAFDTSDGFSAKSYVEITLDGIISEQGSVTQGDWYTFDELQKTEKGIAWRVLFGNDCEWTIEAQHWSARFYFYPKHYVDYRESGDFFGYVKTLQIEQGLHWVSPALTSEITSLEPFCLAAGALTVREGVFIGNVRVADSLEECVGFIHSELYEDPEAMFAEPVAIKDLKSFALGTDLERKVRAWNTMYANPHALQDMINEILLALQLEQEDEMLQHAYVNYFVKEGILAEAVKNKFKHLLT